MSAKETVVPTMPLSALHPGDQAILAGIHTDPALHQRLLALGFRSGKVVQVIRRASFGGPLQVRIGATDILLRITEAEQITVQQQ